LRDDLWLFELSTWCYESYEILPLGATPLYLMALG